MQYRFFQNIKLYSAFFIATGFGSGLCPKIPGTAGTLVGILLAYLGHRSSIIVQWMICLIIFLLGFWATLQMEAYWHSSDDPRIVIDEILGYWVSVIYVPFEAFDWFLAFLLFRFFDIKKIFPIRAIDQISKKHPSRWIRAWAVLFDDVLAGAQTFIVIKIYKILLAFL